MEPWAGKLCDLDGGAAEALNNQRKNVIRSVLNRAFQLYIK